MKKQITAVALMLLILSVSALFANSQDVSGMAKTNLRSANMYMGQKNYEKAQPMYEAVLEEYPNNLEALQNLGGIVYEVHNDYKRTYELYTQAIDAIDVLMGEYEAMKMEDEKAAKKFYKKYIQKAQLDEARENMIKLKASCWVKLYNIALNTYKEDKTQEALDLFVELDALAPDSVKTIAMIATSYSKMGDVTNELKYLELAFSKDTTDVKMATRIAGTYFEQKNYETAIKWFEKAMALDVEDINTAFNLALAYSKVDNNEKAYEYFLKVKDLEPTNAENYKNASVYADKLGKTDEALELLKQALEIDPEDTKNLQYLCVNLMRLERYEEVVTYAEKWYNADNSSKAAVQLLVAASVKLNDEPLRKKYTAILQGMK